MNLSDTTDLPVLTADGLLLGRVRDAVVDHEAGRVLAFGVRGGPDPTRVLPFAALVELTDRFACALSRGALVPAALLPEVDEARGRYAAPRRVPVRLADGAAVARVHDLDFDPFDGTVRAYHLGPDAGRARRVVTLPAGSFAWRGGSGVVRGPVAALVAELLFGRADG